MITDNMETFLVGAFQLMTSVIVVGWVWSVVWGVELVRRSLRRGSTGRIDEKLSTDEAGSSSSSNSNSQANPT